MRQILLAATFAGIALTLNLAFPVMAQQRVHYLSTITVPLRDDSGTLRATMILSPERSGRSTITFRDTQGFELNQIPGDRPPTAPAATPQSTAPSYPPLPPASMPPRITRPHAPVSDDAAGRSDYASDILLLQRQIDGLTADLTRVRTRLNAVTSRP